MKLFLFSLMACCLISADRTRNPVRQGKDFALFFAVEDYQEWKNLRKPIDDAEVIASDLKDLYGFQTEVVRNPDRNTIYDKLDEYARKRYAKDAQLFIFFSGHGDFIKGKGEGFFIPSNGRLQDRYQDSYLPHNRLRSIVDNIPCEHILLAIDACYSGTFDESIASKSRSPFSKNSRLGMNDNVQREQFINNTLRYKSRLYITSGGKERTPDPSEFAAQLKKGLRNFGGEDGILEFHELFYGYLNKAKPSPRFGAFGSNADGANFLFIQQKAKPAPLSNDDISEQEKSVWAIAQQQNTESSYRAYLQFYPDGRYKNSAKLALEGFKNTPPDDMIFIQGGTFTMGDQFGDGQDDEKPLHQVTLDDYYLARTETTNQQFVNFLNDIRLSVDNESGEIKYKNNVIYDLSCNYYCDNWEERILNRNARFEPKVGYENHPVAMVTWYGAVSYCNWKSQQEGLQQVYSISEGKVSANWSANGYRLPTEAEWEYAARSRGKKYKYAWGNSTTPHGSLRDAAFSKAYNNSDNLWKDYNDGYKNTSPVGKFEQGDLGLADMTGNVWEWCWDWFGDYSASSEKNPKGAATGKYRVLRGGSWGSNPTYCRVSLRDLNYPVLRDSSVGFRCARAR